MYCLLLRCLLLIVVYFLSIQCLFDSTTWVGPDIDIIPGGNVRNIGELSVFPGDISMIPYINSSENMPYVAILDKDGSHITGSPFKVHNDENSYDYTRTCKINED